jgi:hypothetical protein
MNRDMVRAAAQFAAYTVLIFAPVLGIHAIAYALVPSPAPHKAATELIRLCATEDSTNSFWDASEQGNGLGQDLWN